MDITQYAITAGQHTDAALSAGNIDEAIRLSGEATATLDAEWTRLHNAGDKKSDEALIASNFIAGRHLESLIQGGAYNEAYATATLLLYRSTMARSKSATLMQSQLDILCHMLTAALQTGDQCGYTSPQAEGDVIEHFAHIISYISSMLYAFYLEVGAHRPDSPVLEEAYNLLEQMRDLGAVQSPNIIIKDKEVAASDISGILPDLLGRSKALGMLQTTE